MKLRNHIKAVFFEMFSSWFDPTAIIMILMIAGRADPNPIPSFALPIYL